MDPETFQAILETLNGPVVFADNGHIIHYLNRAARIRYYERRGYADLIGKSLLDCHNPASRDSIRAIHARFLAGEEEIPLPVNKAGEHITVIAVRGRDGRLLGYYERFENPA